MNVKRMEVMIEELSENFDRHVASSTQSYHFVMNAVDGKSNLSIWLYSQGCDAELEILAFCQGAQPICSVSVDGQVVDEREGAITIAPISLAKGWRVVEISGSNMSLGRARIKGSISQASILEN